NTLEIALATVPDLLEARLGTLLHLEPIHGDEHATFLFLRSPESMPRTPTRGKPCAGREDLETVKLGRIVDQDLADRRLIRRPIEQQVHQRAVVGIAEQMSLRVRPVAGPDHSIGSVAYQDFCQSGDIRVRRPSAL